MHFKLTKKQAAHLEEPEHVKHWRVSWDARHVAHVQLANARVVRAAPELQQLFHKHQANDVLLVVTPALCVRVPRAMWSDESGWNQSHPADDVLLVVTLAL
jgi:hypothetical protein